jgi:uncharacterized membrane-anchored protein YitT (DUF2179 family)
MLSKFIPLTAGQISVIANVTLLLVAFVVLGRGMAIKTLVGSLLTTVFIGAFEKLLYKGEPFIENNYLAAILGALIIAIASGVMFYVDSSSGGTDIIALIIKKYVKINVGRALLISDIIIVIGGGILGGAWNCYTVTDRFYHKGIRYRYCYTNDFIIYDKKEGARPSFLYTYVYNVAFTM